MGFRRPWSGNLKENIQFLESHHLMVRLAVILFVAAVSLPAQLKLAIINSQQAVVDTAEIKKAQAEMEAKFKPRQSEVEKIQQEIANLQNQLQSGQGKITPQQEQNLTAQGQ